MAVKIKGLNKLLRDLKKFGEEGERVFAETTETNAFQIQKNAKSLAPGDMGDLRQEIMTFKVGKLTYKVIANANGRAPYSAYVEFGTGRKVSVPAEMQKQAGAFKGLKTGSFEDGLQSIAEWCKRKGIPVDAAYPIFISILNNGLQARPYLYPSFVRQKPKYLKDLNDDLKRLSGKV